MPHSQKPSVTLTQELSSEYTRSEGSRKSSYGLTTKIEAARDHVDLNHNVEGL